MPRFARVYFTFNRFLVETSFPEGGAFGVGGRLFLLLLLVVVTIIIIHGFERVQRFFPRDAL